MKKILLVITILVSFCYSSLAQSHLTFMGIPITGKREAMMAKLERYGFTEKTQENEIAVELKGEYLGSKAWLRIYNSDKSKTVYLIDIFFPKGKFMDLYDQYVKYRQIFNSIYGYPTEILDDSFEETLKYGQYPMCTTCYESSKGLITLEISEEKHCVEISFQDAFNAKIMRNEKPKK